jgi:hypothetical protein
MTDKARHRTAKTIITIFVFFCRWRTLLSGVCDNRLTAAGLLLTGKVQGEANAQISRI